jgi:hypothetical protein
MLNVGTLFLVLALVLFVLAGLNIPSNGKVRCEWFAFACIVAAWLVGSTPLPA